jgi:tRNA nucleotidyltransferase (CCA-adding enzyme)
MPLKLLHDMAKQITPTPEETRQEVSLANEMAGKLRRHAGKRCRVIIAGSIAKRTFLRDSKDIDIFLLFSKETKKSEFEGIVRKLVARAFPSLRHEVRYAEHPYLRMHYHGRKVDIVPAYQIKNASERLSAVDRSILHTKYILGKLGKSQRREVLLLKKFLRAGGIYGAEIKVEGFSGYLCELLIVHYKSFASLLKATKKWKNGTFIDIEKYYKTKRDIENAGKKFGAPLVAIDPTDKNRNVAAAVSVASMKKFILLASRFLKKPSTEFFSAPETFDEGVRAMVKRKGVAYSISFPAPDAVDDILWGQLKKLSGQFVKFLQSKDFSIRAMLLDSNGKVSEIAILLESDRLPDKKLILGPATKLKKNAGDFKKAHRGARFVVKSRRIAAYVKRDIKDFKGAAEKFFSSASLPSHFSNAKNSHKISRIR